MKITRPLAIILKEREPNVKKEKVGWIVILAGQDHQRELLAVLTSEVGFDSARQFAEILARKYGVTEVIEETSPATSHLESH